MEEVVEFLNNNLSWYHTTHLSEPIPNDEGDQAFFYISVTGFIDMFQLYGTNIIEIFISEGNIRISKEILEYIPEEQFNNHFDNVTFTSDYHENESSDDVDI